jgi:TetR/AcrR family transcriptional repressor of lmrAB and yxaGH operons
MPVPSSTPPSSTPPARERILATTRVLLQRHGFHGTGLNTIAAGAGAPKGSLYFHFPGGKEQIVCDAVLGSGALGAEVIRATVAEAPTVLAAVEAMYDGFATQLAQSGYADGCPLSTVVSEMAPHSDAIAAASHQAFAQWTAPIAERLGRDGYDDADASRRAIAVLSMLEGAIILAKAARSTVPIDACRSLLADLLAG